MLDSTYDKKFTLNIEYILYNQTKGCCTTWLILKGMSKYKRYKK